MKFYPGGERTIFSGPKFLTHGSLLRAVRAHESSAIIFISLGTGSALEEKEKKIGLRQKKNWRAVV